MLLIRANVDYQVFITGRDVEHAIGFRDKPGAAGFIRASDIRPTDIEINRPQYDLFAIEVQGYNATFPAPTPPEPTGDRLILRNALQDPATDPVIKAIIRVLRQVAG